jgi:hypothetical protein
MHDHLLCYRHCKSVSQCYDQRFAFDGDLCRSINDPHSKRSLELSVEHRGYIGQHHGQSGVNNYLYGNGNQFHWLLKNGFHNGDSRPVAKPDRRCFPGSNLYRSILHPDSEWGIDLSVEHGSHLRGHHR